jgi:hypothetical protein
MNVGSLQKTGNCTPLKLLASQAAHAVAMFHNASSLKSCRVLPPGSVVIIPAAKPQYMAGVIPHKYRQVSLCY